jgi:hypothetical protein
LEKKKKSLRGTDGDASQEGAAFLADFNRVEWVADSVQAACGISGLKADLQGERRHRVPDSQIAGSYPKGDMAGGTTPSRFGYLKTTLDQKRLPICSHQLLENSNSKKTVGSLNSGR